VIYQLPLWLRRLLAVSLLVTVLGLTALLTVVPFLSQLAIAREQIDDARTVHGRLLAANQTATMAEQLEQQSRSTTATTTLAGALTGALFIEGESEAIRLASLQSQVVEILAANAIRPRTARMMQARERHTLKLVGVQLQLSATIDQLQKILLQIEAHRPVLLVESLHLTPSTSVQIDEDRGQLDVRLDVVAIEARPSELRTSAPRPKAP
jgi:Type II secretion system (T2SS), protein M subtype b